MKPLPSSAIAASADARTPMAFVQAMLLAYERAGVDPSGALRRAHIAPAQVCQPGARITAAQMEAICGHAMQELDDEALGWFSRRLPWGSYGMLCRASITSPHLGLAMTRWCRHHRLLIDDITLAIEVRGTLATITLSEHRPLGPMREFCLVSTLRYLHGYACWAVDSRIALQAVSFPFERPAHHDAYPLMFPGPVRFGAPNAGFAFDGQYLDLPLRRDESALQAMLVRALPLTVLQYRRDRLLVQRVREALRRNQAVARSAEHLAHVLHLSVRTLHRHLHDEGATLQALKDEARREQAIEWLARTQRPIKQVAQAVGFASEKSFARAFRSWTGQTPSAFRRAGRSAVAPAIGRTLFEAGHGGNRKAGDAGDTD